MKRFLIITISIILGSCTSKKEYAVTVDNIGALKEIMHQGKFQARVKLDTLAQKGIYGLGAADSLGGEVMIVDGVVYESIVQDTTAIVNENANAEATLLVYAKVHKWDTLLVNNLDTDLEAFIARKAESHKLIAPFPFIVSGRPRVKYHVINFDAKNGDIKNHKGGAYYDEINNEVSIVLGFYATDAKGIYTHHDSDVHMHVLNKNKTVMGHVEAIDFDGDNFQLLLPAK